MGRISFNLKKEHQGCPSATGDLKVSFSIRSEEEKGEDSWHFKIEERTEKKRLTHVKFSIGKEDQPSFKEFIVSTLKRISPGKSGETDRHFQYSIDDIVMEFIISPNQLSPPTEKESFDDCEFNKEWFAPLLCIFYYKNSPYSMSIDLSQMKKFRSFIRKMTEMM
jgi:hypothetical protein